MDNEVRNTRELVPPLTFLDKFLYFFVFIISFFAILSLVVLTVVFQMWIAFGNAETVAFRSNASVLLVLPFLLYLEISLVIIIMVRWKESKPIFGSKKYSYGEYPFKSDCVPLFYKKKNRSKNSPSKKVEWNKLLAWCLGLIVCAALVPLSLFGRNEMLHDNSIIVIDSFNQISDTYTTDDFDSLTIKTKKVKQRNSWNYDWGYEITVKMKDGASYAFSDENFNYNVPSGKSAALDKMLEIKGLFVSESIEIIGAESTNNVAEHLKLDETQKAKLNELFKS